jgi:hypothetical protein
VPQDRVRKFTPENQELARTLHSQMKALSSKSKGAPPKGKGARANGSDFSSARGSEEPGRHASVAAAGGRRRHRDYETEPVSRYIFFVLFVLCFCWVSLVWFWCVHVKTAISIWQIW